MATPVQHHSASVKNVLNITVIVAGLGYFVDIYDLILFGIVREPSLRAIGITDETALLHEGIKLLNWQMAGMLIGGIIWGILGDKMGRLYTLFLTIFLYSIANLANGFVQTIEQYAFLRFFAGIGLAGELGVGITLVSEVMTKESRGYGTSIVSGIGIAGAALGFAVAQKGHLLFNGVGNLVGAGGNFLPDDNWKIAYWMGGILGLVLLVLRISVYESGMFAKTKQSDVKRGDFISLFTRRGRFLKYLYCIIIGLPIWYVIGILVIFSSDFAKNVFHIEGSVNAGKAIMWHYIGASFGSFLWGIISQMLKSRKKAILIALLTLTLLIGWYLAAFGSTPLLFYVIIFIMGIAMGYWAVFITVGAEQFGTNLRSTVATTVPNFVRGATVPMTMSFQALIPLCGQWAAGVIVGFTVMALALFALFKLEETYGKDLDYVEQI